MKTALILEGGAMRGMFTAGVIDTMMEQGITYDAVIGVSAGACFGCNYKSKQIGRPLRYNLRFAKEWRYCSLRSWITTGDLYGAKFCYHTLPDHLDIMDKETYDSNPSQFIVVCTDVNTGLPVYRSLDTLDENALEWIRASASMPVASRIVHLDGYELLDGGISDSIPVKYMERMGFDRLVIVLTQPEDYIKQPQKYIQLLRLVLHRYPKTVKALATRHVRYNKTLSHIRQLEQSGNAFVIRPPHALQIGSVEHDRAEIQRVYQEGRKIAALRADELQKYLKAETHSQQ